VWQQPWQEPSPAGFGLDELESGLVALPFGGGLLLPGQTAWVEATPARMMAGPYRLSVSGQDDAGLFVRDVRVGNECLFIGTGGVPARDFRLDPDKPWKRGLVPMTGPTCRPGVLVRVQVENSSCATQTVSVTLWGRTLRHDVDDKKWLACLPDCSSHRGYVCDCPRAFIPENPFPRQPPMEMRGVIPPTIATARAEASSITLRQSDPLPSGRLLGRPSGSISDVPTMMTTAQAMMVLRDRPRDFAPELTPEPPPPVRLQLEWFGQSWGADICSESRHRLVPFAQCAGCHIDIEREDSGFIVADGWGSIDDVPHVGIPRRLSYHRHCFHRLIGASIIAEAAVDERLVAARAARDADCQATLVAMSPKPALDEDPAAAWESACDEWP
jgi:hypothetical protein